jgi:hypothetical protein
MPNQGIEPQLAIYKIAILTVVLIRQLSRGKNNLHGDRTHILTVKE